MMNNLEQGKNRGPATNIAIGSMLALIVIFLIILLTQCDTVGEIIQNVPQ